ncbi:hypothetical protein PHLCEN_2v9890 [Hermanssonia centrifuga]|uniref:Uncharacterized protein n=1 Tax=Hermanssonia centrifuga TaxID=98765 RepID=A0A2R6NPK6_9APHY|nr:hypothetical protein PHLCEN_2v9890 [Hermanssonia centrifuga]
MRQKRCHVCGPLYFVTPDLSDSYFSGIVTTARLLKDPTELTDASLSEDVPLLTQGRKAGAVLYLCLHLLARKTLTLVTIWEEKCVVEVVLYPVGGVATLLAEGKTINEAPARPGHPIHVFGAPITSKIIHPLIAATGVDDRTVETRIR